MLIIFFVSLSLTPDRSTAEKQQQQQQQQQHYTV